jgi:hypothetical protein
MSFHTGRAKSDMTFDQRICGRIDAQNPSIGRNSMTSTTSAMNPTKLPKIMATVRADGLLDGRSSLKL